MQVGIEIGRIAKPNGGNSRHARQVW